MDEQSEPTKTLDQHAADLNAWLESRGLTLMMTAQGKRTGKLSPIEDFMPETHAPTFLLQVRR